MFNRKPRLPLVFTWKPFLFADPLWTIRQLPQAVLCVENHTHETFGHLAAIVKRELLVPCRADQLPAFIPAVQEICVSFGALGPKGRKETLVFDATYSPFCEGPEGEGEADYVFERFGDHIYSVVGYVEAGTRKDIAPVRLEAKTAPHPLYKPKPFANLRRILKAFSLRPQA